MTKAKELKVTLANGEQVTWDVFVTWSSHKQRMSLDPHTYRVVWGDKHSKKMRKIVTDSYKNGTRCINWNFGGRNGVARPVVTPAGEFGSIKEAADFYKVSGETFKNWLKDISKPEIRYSKEMSPEEKARLHPGQRAVKTPSGVFPSLNSAARHYDVGVRTIKTWIRSQRTDEFQYLQ